MVAARVDGEGVARRRRERQRIDEGQRHDPTATLLTVARTFALAPDENTIAALRMLAAAPEKTIALDVEPAPAVPFAA